jgi:hypothetical protein
MGQMNRRYFESLMADHDLSLRGLAQKMGMGHSQLSLTFSGARRLTLDEASQLSQLFGQPLHKIVENAGVTVRPVTGRRVPVLGAVNGDGTVTMNPADVIERAEAPDDLPGDAVAVQARTSNTPLDWLDGAVFFLREPNGIAPDVLGRFALCQIKSGPAVVAGVRRGYQDGTYRLVGTFSRDNAELTAATPILLTRN